MHLRWSCPARAGGAPRYAGRRSVYRGRSRPGRAGTTSSRTLASVLKRNAASTCACRRRRESSACARARFSEFEGLRLGLKLDLALAKQGGHRNPGTHQQPHHRHHREAVQPLRVLPEVHVPRGHGDVEREDAEWHHEGHCAHLQRPPGDPAGKLPGPLLENAEGHQSDDADEHRAPHHRIDGGAEVGWDSVRPIRRRW